MSPYACGCDPYSQECPECDGAAGELDPLPPEPDEPDTEDRPMITAQVEAVVMKALESEVRKHLAVLRALAGAGLDDGDKVTVRSPLDGSKLGIVLRTDPDPGWEITDRAALIAHLARQPGTTETVYEVHTPDATITLAPLDELTHVLLTHAPHMLHEVQRVTDSAVSLAIAQAVKGEPPAPGLEWRKPSGSVTVRPDKAAPAAIARLHAAGLIGWDGRPALPAGDAA